MVKDLAILPNTADEAMWTEDQKALMIAAGAYRKEGENFILAPASVVIGFLHQCEKSGLDPVARQIYLIYRGGKWQIQGAIDGFRVVAGRHTDYDGSEPDWQDEDGNWYEVWPDRFKEVDGNRIRVQPTAARVKVYSTKSIRPTVGIAKWSEFAIIGRGGENWEKMPSHMLAKVAEAHALRKRYPEDFSGIYTADEMGDPAALEGSYMETSDWKQRIADVNDVDTLKVIMAELRAAGEWTEALDLLGRAKLTKLTAEGKLHPEIVIPVEDQEPPVPPMAGDRDE